MTSITVERALLEQALAALECAYSENYDGAKIHGAKVAIRAHLTQPITCYRCGKTSPPDANHICDTQHRQPKNKDDLP